LIMAQSGRLELGDNIRGHYRSMFNHRDVIARQSAAKQSNSVKKTQNKDSIDRQTDSAVKIRA